MSARLISEAHGGWPPDDEAGRTVGDENVVVAMVDGRAVTLQQIHRRLKIRGALDLVRESAIEALLDAAIAEYDVQVEDAALQSAADAFRADRRLFKAEDARAWLAAQGFVLDDFEAGLERDLQLAELRLRVISDEAVSRRFAEMRARFSRARISVLETENEAQAEEARAQIEDDETDFGALAGRLAKDADLRDSGGYVGWVTGADMDDAIRPLVLSARPGAVIGPARSGAGWALVKVWETAEAVLTDTVAAEIRAGLFQDWLEDRLSAVTVESPLLAANDG